MEEIKKFTGFVTRSDSENSILNLKLDEIPDEEFNKLLTNSDKIEVKTNKRSIIGNIVGGSDPTRPLRFKGIEIKPQQQLTILADQKLEEDIKKTKAELIFNA